MSTKPPRAFSRPADLPLFAWIVDGQFRGICHFENPASMPDRHMYLPVHGDEPAADLERQYFVDSYEIKADHVVRTRVVHDREVA
jgi:hypothetical protein